MSEAPEPVGIGLIGCGGRLRGLVNRLVSAHDGLVVNAICDTDGAAVRETRERCNPDAKAYDDYRALVEDRDVQWVMIGSWNAYHADHACAAMDAGKDVFCEKPLATTLEDCIRMRQTQQRTGRRFFIGFTLRYSPHYTKLKALIDDGAVGDIVSMEFNETLNFNHGAYIHQDWRRWVEYAGTHLLEKCCHDVDIANWITGGALPVRVASFGGLDFFKPENAHHVDRIGPNPHTGHQAYHTFGGRGDMDNPFLSEKDIIDNQVAILEYANRVRSTFHTNCHAARNERRNYICGTEGTLRADAVSHSIELKRVGWEEPLTVYDTSGGGGHGGADPKLVNWLAQCMREDETPRAGMDEGLKSAVTCFGIDEAMDTGQVVDLHAKWQQLGIETGERATTAAR